MGIQTTTTASRPWWRESMMWLVVGGPAVVVAASIATFVIALHGADVPLQQPTVRSADTMAPATQARNHVVAPAR